MKKKDLRRFVIRRNSRGYWEKGGGSEDELRLALVCLVIACAALAVAIFMRIWG